MVRWGILGAGNIARRFCESLMQEPDSMLWAVSCRTEEKAAGFAAQYGAHRYYGDFAELLEDPEVDAVYLAVPHGYHKEWAARALKAGKAVLCEKPAALNEDQMQEIAETAGRTGTLFMEAMKPRFVPLYPMIKERVQSGVIGELLRVDTSLCNQMDFEKKCSTYHTEPGQGGALLDVGTYCASWLEEFLSGDPKVMQIESVVKQGIDHYIAAELQFGTQAAALECSFDRKKPRNAVLVGTKGKIIVEELHRPQRAVICEEGKEPEELYAPYEKDDFYGEIHHFVTCLELGKTESERMPLKSSVRCAGILDRIRQEAYD